MKFTPTALAGVTLIELEELPDDRGFFARSFCDQEFAEAGLTSDFSQMNVSFNERRGTLRGLHYQAAPAEEVKVVRCTAGAVFDVAVDVRAESPTRGQWIAVELTADNRHALYVPAGCAHGFVSLTDRSELLYMMSVPYEPDLARGIRWDDPRLAIDWPISEPILSDRDASLPLFES